MAIEATFEHLDNCLNTQVLFSGFFDLSLNK
jgi:hypothetical protein